MKFEPGGFARGASSTPQSLSPRVHIQPQNLDLKSRTYPKRQISRGILRNSVTLSACFGNPACNRLCAREDERKVLLNCLPAPVKHLVPRDFTNRRSTFTRRVSRHADRWAVFV